MATVKITKDLIESVMTRARGVHSPQIYAARRDLDRCGWTAESLVAFVVPPEALTYLNRPEVEQFIAKVKEIELDSVNGHRADLTFPALNPVPFAMKNTTLTIMHNGVPAGQATLTRSYVGATTGRIRLSDVPSSLLGGLDVVLAQANAERVRLQRVQDEYLRSITKVLQTFSTLAPALKAWPALWELLPDDIREKHKMVREKPSARAEPVVDVDLGKLTAITAAHRMGL